jgi:energy-coupling factor transporter transmembrane protein EcfT
MPQRFGRGLRVFVLFAIVSLILLFVFPPLGLLMLAICFVAWMCSARKNSRRAARAAEIMAENQYRAASGKPLLDPNPRFPSIRRAVLGLAIVTAIFIAWVLSQVADHATQQILATHDDSNTAALNARMIQLRDSKGP